MSTPSKEEARAAAEAYFPHGDVRPYATRHFIAGYLAALASRVSTPPSEDAVDRAARAMYRLTHELSMSGARDLARGALAVLPSEADVLEAFARRMANGIYLETGGSEHHEAFNRAHMDAARLAFAEAARLRGAVPAVPVPPTEPETLAPMSPVFEDSLTDDEWVERRLAAPTEAECWCSDIAQSYGLTDPGCPRHEPAPKPTEEKR